MPASVPAAGLGSLVTNGEPTSTDFRPKRKQDAEGLGHSTPVSPWAAAARAARKRRGGKQSTYWRIELPMTEVAAAPKRFRDLLQPPHWANAEDRKARAEALEMIKVFIKGCLENRDTRRIGGYVGYRRGRALYMQLYRERSTPPPSDSPTSPS